jgi:hypothetical protein
MLRVLLAGCIKQKDELHQLSHLVIRPLLFIDFRERNQAVG